MSDCEFESCCNDFKCILGPRVIPVQGIFIRVWCFARKSPAVQLPKHMTAASDRKPVMDLLSARLAALSMTAELDRLELDPG